MTDFLALALAMTAGFVLGGIFFGGLWWTVRLGLASQQPAPWFLGSVLVRTAIALTGFYLVGHEHWQRLAWCLLGFIMARLTVRWLTRVPAASRAARTPEAGHAP